jgi:hypothetical protein
VDARFAGGRGREGETGVLEVVTITGSGQADIHQWSGLEWSRGASRFSRYRVEEDVQAPELNFRRTGYRRRGLDPRRR